MKDHHEDLLPLWERVLAAPSHLNDKIGNRVTVEGHPRRGEQKPALVIAHAMYVALDRDLSEVR